MKNSILTVLAVAAMVACKKNETTTSDQSADTTATMSAPADTSMTTGDSATTAASNSNTATNALSAQDKKFADAAATGGMMEVMLGQLASSNASNATVKSLGAMMVKDHGKANDELKKWASASGYTLPTSLNADQQKKI